MTLQPIDWLIVVALVLLAASQTTWTQQPTTHELPLRPANVHWGYYDSRVPPALTTTRRPASSPARWGVGRTPAAAATAAAAAAPAPAICPEDSAR